MEDGGWIRTFSRVVRLDVDSSRQGPDDSKVSLAPFHRFSLILKSLRLFSNLLPHSRIIALVHSLPFLEDLTLIVYGSANNDDFDISGPPGAVPPPSSPPFTGPLSLVPFKGMGPVTRRLLDLTLRNSGFYGSRRMTFNGYTLWWRSVFIPSRVLMLPVTCLVRFFFGSRIEINPPLCAGGLPHASIDPPKATKLRDARFWCAGLRAEWITVAL